MTKIEMINAELDLLLKGIEEDWYNDERKPFELPSKDGARFIVREIKRQILEL